VWLVVFIAYIYAAAMVSPLTHHASAETVIRLSVAVVLGLAFFWWGLRFLVGSRVLPGGDARRGGHGGVPGWLASLLRLGLPAAYRLERGYLRGAGHRADRAVVAGRRRLGHLWRPVFGRWFHDGWLRAWADNHRGHRQPGDAGEGYGQDSEPAHEDPNTSPR
jgi:hypothetical protein